MIFEHLFAWLGDLMTWLGSLLPSTGCVEVAAFSGFDIGYLNNYISIPLAATVFAVVVGFEVAVFGFRLAVAIYKLLPFT